MVYRAKDDQDEGDVYDGTRVCRQCSERKSMTEFHWAGSRKHRVRLCKSCAHARQAEKTAERKQAGELNYQADYLRREYGLTPEKFAAMRAVQHDACALCLKPFGSAYGSRMHVDHCHATGHSRAILCHNCNVGLGHFHDDVDLILKAASYVTEHRKRVEGLPSPRRMLTKLERQENRRKAALRQHRSEEGQAALARRSATFRGESNHAARLRAEDVVEIRRLYAAGGISQRELGDRFGVTQSHIGYIVKRKVWAHVP